MTERTERPDDPPLYPRDRSFGALLIWHVAWGTRSKLGTTERNTQWVPADLASLIHIPGTRPGSAKKSFQNWRNQGRLPEAADADKIERLFSELFGEAPALRFWKDDLRAALERDRAKSRAERKADAIAFRNEKMGIDHGGTDQKESTSSQDAMVPQIHAGVIEASPAEDGVYPNGYPRSGTYSELLHWHLKIWGTRPGCSLEIPNELPNLFHFALATHEGGFWGRRTLIEGNVSRWLSVESPANPYSIKRVELELFGNDERLNHWKAHLRAELLK